ncbi:hypothetical protein CVT25_009523 [Psilocybe cyanescens]|uniref:Uncharacterized protein n=1 Tax=Psilocybe cyanescens TaxID=93625 RepID=A0A409WWV7_PSICY|nr:hypothetical protein CVT25_009523 [Psilocybe cyanescens]
MDVIAGLFVAVTAIEGLNNHLTSDAKANLFNKISSALMFVSLGTTVITTILIGHKIHCAARSRHHLRRLFYHILTLVIESGAAYSLALVVNAITVASPSFALLGSPLAHVRYYANASLPIVSTGDEYNSSGSKSTYSEQREEEQNLDSDWEEARERYKSSSEVSSSVPSLASTFYSSVNERT